MEFDPLARVKIYSTSGNISVIVNHLYSWFRFFSPQNSRHFSRHPVSARVEKTQI